MPDIFKRLIGLQDTKYTHQKWLNVICRIIIILYTVNTFFSYIDSGIFGIIIAAIRSAVAAVIYFAVFAVIKSVITNRVQKKENDKLKQDAPAEKAGMIEMDKSRIESQRLGRIIAITSTLMLVVSYIAFWMLMANVYDGDNGILIGAALILIVSPFIISSSIMGKKKMGIR